MTTANVSDASKVGAFVRALCLCAVSAAIVWPHPGEEGTSYTALPYLVLGGSIYVLAATFLPLARLAPQWRGRLITLLDVGLVTGVVILSGGLRSSYQMLYCLPLLDSARRRQATGAVEAVVIIAVGYMVLLAVGLPSLVGVRLKTEQIVLVLGAIALFAAWLGPILRENWAYKRELDRLRDELTAMLVHDLKNPLSTIIGTLQPLKEGVLGPIEPQQREFLDMALQGSRTLLEMVNTLLDIGRLEAAKFPLDRDETDLRSLIEGALQDVKVPAAQRGVNLSSQVPPQTPRVTADQTVIRRVITNLLSNAIRFTPNGGQVAVSTAFSEDIGGVIVTVSDTGQGIPKDYHEKIFEKFGQVQLRQAGTKTGTGLGLTFCKLAIEAHGGRIWVESEEGKGTRMSFLLPVASPRDAKPKIEAADHEESTSL
jgi:signal transduction histidine kinase